jgi:hypothetical protein
MKLLRAIAGEVGRGLIAGLVGTVAMTIASTIEMKARKRRPSTVPGETAGKVLGVRPRDEKSKQRFSSLVHFGYGTAWGLARAALRAAFCAGGRRRASIAEPLAFFATVWGAGLVLLPMLGTAPPFWRWGGKVVAIDALHHGVYAAATDGAYRLLARA